MNDSPTPEQNLQKILENAKIGGDLSIGDIEQILKIFNQSHSGSGDNVAGDKVINFYTNLLEKYQPKNTPHNIPSSNTIKFVGRAGVIQKLDRQLKENNQLAITAVKGMGGVGKTELAIQYSLVYLLTKSYEGGICWLKAREENIGLQIVRFAQTYLDLNPPEDWDLQQQVEFVWSRWHSKKSGNVLVVIDDVTDYQEIESYLPPQPSLFKVLITTRLNLEEVKSVTLDVLDEADAIELLRQWVGKEKIDQQIEDVEELCWRLGYLPLALNLVGRYTRKKKITIKELLNRLEAKGLSHQSLIVDKKNKTSKTSTLKIERGVEAAFELSWEELSPQAQQLGCLLSIFALAPIIWQLVEMIEKETDKEELEDARIELENLHLLQSPADSVYQLHQLIREYFQEKLALLSNQDNIKRSYVKLMVRKSKQMPRTPTLDKIATFEPIIPHITEVADNLTQSLTNSNQEILGIFTSITRFYQGQGLYSSALPYSEQCVRVTSERLGDEHLDVVTSNHNLAELYRCLGKYEKAEKLYNRALDMIKKIVGEEDIEVASLINNLAGLYRSVSQYEKAEKLYNQALDMIKKIAGEEHPDVARTINNLAELYRCLGKYEKAEKLYNQALDMIKKVVGEKHPDVATLMDNLASLYCFQGQYKQAKIYFLQALNIRKTMLGEKHPDVARTMNNLASLYFSQRKYQQAESHFLKSLTILSQKLEQDHPDIMKVRDHFVSFLRQVIQEGRIFELSDNTITQSLLKQIKSESTADTEIVSLEIELPQTKHPWMEFAGMYKDNPLFDEVLEDIQTNRRKIDQENQG